MEDEKKVTLSRFEVGSSSQFALLYKPSEYECRITNIVGNGYVLGKDESGNPVTKHSTALVPLCHICNEPVPFRKDTGKLADIAPTLLTMMGLEVPSGMEGDVLV